MQKMCQILGKTPFQAINKYIALTKIDRNISYASEVTSALLFLPHSLLEAVLIKAFKAGESTQELENFILQGL